MSKSCSLHPKGTVRHAYLRVDWDTRELSLIHECRDPTSGEPGDDGGVPTHEWPETVKDQAAVLRRLGLSRIGGGAP